MTMIKMGTCSSCRTVQAEPEPASRITTEQWLKKSEGKGVNLPYNQILAHCGACQDLRVFNLWQTTYESV